MMRAQPQRSGLFLDYDGTLAPIVADPASATPLPGVPETLRVLGERFGVVAVVSGRPAAFLAEALQRPPGVRLLGLYGLEEVGIDGMVVTAEGTEGWQAVVEAVITELRQSAPAGLGVEDKGLSVTLHWRTAPSLGSWAGQFAADCAVRTGLDAQVGRASVELRPPIAVDKGSVLLRLAQGCQAIGCFGDDVGDLPAFVAAGELATRGVDVLRVAVGDVESPPALLALADLIVPGPQEALDLLDSLVG
jgi:trehalose 6-phosphate phosphatase